MKKGQAIVEDVPAPQVEPGTVLVSVSHSCISVGTELSGLKASGAPLWKRALQQPDKVRKVFEMAATQGVTYTRNVVQEAFNAGNPTGYSAAGLVLEVGAGIEDLRPGDRVACAGAQYAHHAEIVRVPRNLVAPVPDSMDFAVASTVTLGAIALQGVRRAQPTLGETFVVIGLGIIGQITVQLLKACGCRTIGTDLDRKRIRLAVELGLTIGVHPEDGIEYEQIARLTDGIGADGVIITAATPSDAVVATAFKMCRRKGRVVLVGDVGLHLNRADFYQKELDFFISTSYGPGRYDARYEEQGLDYPVAYVRWTENRNMTEYLRLVATGEVRLEPLLGAVYPIEEAAAAYAVLQGTERPLVALLSYPGPADKPVRRISNPLAAPVIADRIGIAVVGAGSFAKGMHLPNIKNLADRYQLRAIVSRTGHNAAAVARQFGAGYATTDYQEVLNDPNIAAVLIATRHNLHANMTLQALAAGKHVLVEKPLALSTEELDAIEAFYAQAGDRAPVLLTGFNRRFSPYGRRLRELVSGRSNPMILNYRMNAGYIPLEHWVHGPEGGGRNLGEACHIYDLFTYLTDSRVVDVFASAVRPATGHYSARDNFVATITYTDGSVATLTYTALGNKDYPKERLEIFVDGKVLKLDDYRQLTITGAKSPGITTKLSDKGQKKELEAFAEALRIGRDWPIPLWQQRQAMEIALMVESDLK